MPCFQSFVGVGFLFCRDNAGGKGLLLGVELVKDIKTNAPFPALGKALKHTALKNGLIMRIDPSWFAVAPALIAKESDLDEMFALIDKSLKEALDTVTT